MMISGHFIVLFLFIALIKGFPIKSVQNAKVPPATVLNFLKTYGYIEEDLPNSEALYSETGISDTIKLVQKFGNLEETGLLDNATLSLMLSPRCGVPDIRKTRHKRYILGPSSWNKRTITYFVANWSPKLGEKSVVDNMQKALNTWGRYGRLEFARTSTPDADIIVAFGSGFHGDRYSFDGPGYILAHAFFPYEEQGLGGDIHFDADENWTDKNNKDGPDFATVALHELGHSLGLSHSPSPDSVMFPYYRGFDNTSELSLGYDDILGMYELYIRRNIEDVTKVTTQNDVTTMTSTTLTDVLTTDLETTTKDYLEITTTTYTNSTLVVYQGDDEDIYTHNTHDPKRTIPTTNSPSLPNICLGFFDAVASFRDEIFIFKEQYVWRLKEMSKLEPGYPILIHQLFPDLPKSVNKIDAAYERQDGMIILFTGNILWVHDGQRFVDSPRPISEYGLPTTLDKIDAVQVWSRNGKTYIYKADRFWRYNETAKLMDEGYPMHMERWRGVPHNLDAAITYKGITYFFKDELYWKFDNDWVITTDQSPLPTPQIWLGCSEDDFTLRRLIEREN